MPINFVRTLLSTAALDGDTTLTIAGASSPFSTPPDPAVTGLTEKLLLADALGQPTVIEVVSYTGLTDNLDGTFDLTGVTRGLLGTTGVAWPTPAECYVVQPAFMDDIDKTSDEVTLPTIIGSPSDLLTLNDALSHLWSATGTDGFGITDNLNGTVDIASGECLIRPTDSVHDVLVPAAVSASAGLAMTDNDTNFVYVDYNGGSPVIAVTLDPTSINVTTKVPLYVVTREGTTLTYIYVGDDGIDSVGNLRKRFFFTEKFKRVDAGSVVSETGTRNLGCTAGSFYFGTHELTHAAIDTSVTGTFEYYRLITGAWVKSDATQFDNVQFNNISTPGSESLVNIPTNDYATHWVYLLPNEVSTKFAVVYSQASYNNLSQAQAATVPSNLPPSIEGMGQLLGRFIARQGDANGLMETVFEAVFQSTQATVHNGLAGLQGGAADDYQHLTSAQLAKLAGYASETVWSGTTSNATPTEIFVGGVASTRYTIAASSSESFTLQVDGRDTTTGDEMTMFFRGSIKRDGANNTTLSGLGSETTAKDDATWDISVTADDTNEALIITVTGDATNSVEWAAKAIFN